MTVLPNRAHRAQGLNDVGNRLDDIINVLFGVLLAEGQTQRAMRDLMRQADCHQNVGRIERTGRACRTGGAAYACVIQSQDQALALDCLKDERSGARQTVYRIAGVVGVRNVLHDALYQLVGQLLNVAHLLVQTFNSFLHRCCQTNEACGVLGAGNQAALLTAAVYQRLKGDALLHIQNAGAARTAELMAGQGQHIDAHFLHVDVHVADCLNRVGVELSANRMCQLSDFLDRLNGADLVVGRHNGNQCGVLGKLCFKLLEVNTAFLIHVQIGNAVAFLLEGLAGVKHCVMLDLGGDDVLAALGGRTVHKAADSKVVRLRAAAGEYNFARCIVVLYVYRLCRVQALADNGTRVIQRFLCRTADAVQRGRVAVMLGQPRLHSVKRSFGHRGRRRVIRIYESLFHSISAFLCPKRLS